MDAGTGTVDTVLYFWGRSATDCRLCGEGQFIMYACCIRCIMYIHDSLSIYSRLEDCHTPGVVGFQLTSRHCTSKQQLMQDDSVLSSVQELNDCAMVYLSRRPFSLTICSWLSGSLEEVQITLAHVIQVTELRRTSD